MRMRSRILLLLLTIGVLGVGHAQATWQIGDILIYEGKEYSILDSPMEAYFEQHPELNPKDDSLGQCSAAWRGYQAVFAVAGGTLYLKDIFSDPCQQRISALNKVAPDAKRVSFDWYTGLLKSIGGKNYVENPYSPEFLDGFAEYTFFQVDAGKVSKVRHFDNKGYREFKKKQFNAYKKTLAYGDALKRVNDRSAKDAEAALYRAFLFDMDRVYVD